MFLYQKPVNGLPKGQSSIVCMCLINWASSVGSGMKPTASRRTESTKMVDTKLHCMAESILHSALEAVCLVYLSTHE